MKCPRCGNEVSQEEAFCGQCGMPNTPPAKPTEMVSTPPPLNGQSVYPTNAPFPPSRTMQPGAQQPSRIRQQPGMPPDGSFISRQNLAGSSAQQQNGFYQDATEAMSAVPETIEPGYHTGFQQQNYPGSMPTNYPTVNPSGPQMPPFQTGNYSPQAPYTMGQGYDYGAPRTYTPPPARQSSGGVITLICACVLVAVVGGVGALFFLNTRNQPSPASTPQVATATPVATTAPSPTPTATEAATPTPTPIPSPTVAPTPPPDTGFAWCAATCTPYSFSTEYPVGWQGVAATNAPGVQFTNTAQADQYASFKAPGPTNSPAGDLVTSDLQTNFATRAGYTPPASSSTTTISGETWATSIAYYQSDAQQKERVEVFATVHQGKAYIIELQAPDSQFDAVNNQYFNYMLARFQFL